MDADETLLALGLMSGTSLDGIDAALIHTDGRAVVRPGPSLTVPYAPEMRARLRATLGGRGDVAAVQLELTLAHGAVVTALTERAGIAADTVDVIGFHGHTIVHRPDESLTWQIGDGALLAELSGVDVVCDFRSHDVGAGGQGAPLASLYHAALSAGMARPLAVLNLGGVANVTWLGAGDAICAFDTGPGCALLDDWMKRHAGVDYDADGALARRGTVHDDVVTRLLGNSYFRSPPPKSLDRDTFAGAVDGLSAEDGAATLAAFTAAAVGEALTHLSEPPRRWLVTGGGRHNPTVMAHLARVLAVPVEAVEAVGWDGDAMEAQAFAYLAVRAVYGLAVTLPATTGAPRPLTGGALHRHATVAEA